MKLTYSVTRLKWTDQRIPGALVRGGVKTIQQLVQLHPWDIVDRDWRRQQKKKVQGLGARSLKKIIQTLAVHNLTLSMTEDEISKWKEDSR